MADSCEVIVGHFLPLCHDTVLQVPWDFQLQPQNGQVSRVPLEF